MALIPGGKSQRSTEVPASIVAMVKEAMPEIRQQCDDSKLKLVRVRGYRTQVVSGQKYFVDLEVENGAGRASNLSVTIWQKSDQTIEVTDCHPAAS